MQLFALSRPPPAAWALRANCFHCPAVVACRYTSRRLTGSPPDLLCQLCGDSALKHLRPFLVVTENPIRAGLAGWMSYGSAMLDFLRLFLHVLAAPFWTQAQLEDEVTLLRHQLNVLRR